MNASQISQCWLSRWFAAAAVMMLVLSEAGQAVAVSYDEWASGIPNPEQRGEHDTAAADGIPNLLKYASGLAPTTVHAPSELMAIREDDSSTGFSVVFHRSKAATDVRVHAIYRASLTDGGWSTHGVVEEKLADVGDREVWRATVPLGRTGFLRLRAVRTMPPTAGSVGPAGGTVALSDGTRVVIPPGAVSRLIEVTLGQVDPAEYFDAGVGEHQVVISTTVTGTESFAQPVELMIPLTPGMTEADSANVLAGLIDEESGAVTAVPSSIVMEDGRPFAVVRTTHLSRWWFGWSSATPPAQSGRLVIPYYNQGASEYCWAVSLQMVMQAVKFHRVSPVNEIIGRVGVDEDGITALAWRFSSTIRDLVAAHTGVRPTRTQFDFVNRDLARDLIRREVGLNGRPVAVHNTALAGGHAVVVVGYDGGTFFVNDPASTTYDAVGYKPMTWSQLGVGSVGHNLTTLVIPAPVTAGPAPMALNLPHHTVGLLKPATPEDPVSRTFRYRWDYTRSEGCSWGEEGVAEATDPMPGGVTELRFAPGIGIEISNASPTEPQSATVMVHLFADSAPDEWGYHSWSQNVTVPPNSVTTVSHDNVLVDSFRYNRAVPTRYLYRTALVSAGGRTLDVHHLLLWIDGITPELTEIAPASAGVGSVVTLKGRRFGQLPAHNQVLFNGVAATEIVAWGDEEIQVRVPAGADTGPAVVLRGEVASNELPFIVHHGITFACPRLEQAMREMINKPDSPLQGEDFRSQCQVGQRIGRNRQITSLAGMEQLVGWACFHGSFTSFDFGYNAIEDLSPLSGHNLVWSIDLTGNRITDVGPLAGLDRLERLYLGGNQIRDIASLSGLVKITHLSLDGNPIASIAAVTAMSELNSLRIAATQVSDLQPLAGKQHLRFLHANSAALIDISPLASADGLVEVILSDNAIADVSALSGKSSLRTVNAAGNQVTDVAPLAGLAALRTLDVSDNAVTDIHWAGATFDQLNRIDLNRNQIANLDGLAGTQLPELTTLWLGHNNISDISGLAAAGLPQLIGLSLGGNRIRDIGSLSGLHKLEWIHLNGNDMEVIDVLPGLTLLKTLDLRANPNLITNPDYEVTLPDGTKQFVPRSPAREAIDALIDRGVSVQFDRVNPV